MKKENLTWLAATLEKEISKLYDVDGIHHQPDGALLLAKHLKWAIRDGAEVDLKKICAELNAIGSKE